MMSRKGISPPRQGEESGWEDRLIPSGLSEARRAYKKLAINKERRRRDAEAAEQAPVESSIP